MVKALLYVKKGYEFIVLTCVRKLTCVTKKYHIKILKTLENAYP
jgi:hypothetical protein